MLTEGELLLVGRPTSGNGRISSCSSGMWSREAAGTEQNEQTKSNHKNKQN